MPNLSLSAMAVLSPGSHTASLNHANDSNWDHLPSMIDEKMATFFQYWDEGLRSGMRYQNDLYTLFATYPLQERLRASTVGCEQTERGVKVCITVSKTAYSVWLNLRSLNSAGIHNLPSTS